MLGVADFLRNLLQMMMLELCWAVLSAFGNKCTTMGERKHVIGREDETRLLCCLKMKNILSSTILCLESEECSLDFLSGLGDLLLLSQTQFSETVFQGSGFQTLKET